MARQGRTLIDLLQVIVNSIFGKPNRRRPVPRTTVAGEAPSTHRTRTETHPHSHTPPRASKLRPSASKAGGSSKIRFKPAPDDNRQGTSPLSGLRDAFTGELLDPAQGLFQCAKCLVYYQRTSMAVLKSENGGRCVSCLDTKIRMVEAQAAAHSGQNYQVQVVTLADYRQHIGHVITFEGFVPRVNPSRDGRSYAVMFEDTTWNHGLKMVVFKGKVATAQIVDRIGNYVDEYVLCSECESPDTHMVKDGRTSVLHCETCGAHRPVHVRKPVKAEEQKAIEAGKTYDLFIQDVGKKGDGIARKAEFVIYIPGTAKGTQVKARIEKVSGTVAFGVLV